MKRFISKVIIVILFSCSVNAQNGKSTFLSGTVTDSLGSLIPNARVIVSSGRKHFVTTTDQDGFYKLDIKPGIYDLTFKFSPFFDLIIKGYQVAAVRKMVLDVSLIRECDLISEKNPTSKKEGCNPVH